MALFLNHIPSVPEGEKAVSPTVGESNVFKQPQTVHLGISDLLEMRNQVDVRQAQPLKPAFVSRVHRLAGHFGVGVDVFGAVHASGTATQHHTIKALQQLFKADFVDEAVLRGDMPAAHHYPVGLLHQLGRLPGVPALQHDDGGCLDAGCVDALAHPFLHRIRETLVVWGGAHQQHPGVPVRTGDCRQSGLDLGQKAVVRGERRFAETGGTAG